MKKYLLHFLLVIPLALIAVALFTNSIGKVEASISYGNDYLSTTTASTVYTTESEILLKTGQGSLGSLVHTGSSAISGGSIFVYNATTSSVLKRTGQAATSTILLAALPNNAAAGTYTFDTQFTDGLLIVKTGTVGTTTITYR